MTTANLIHDWIAAIAADEPHKLYRRLQWDNLDSAAFEWWLNQEDVDGDLPTQQWRESLATIRDALEKHWQLPLLPYQADCERSFQDIWWPVRIELECWLSNKLGSTAGISHAVFGSLADALLDRLCTISEALLWSRFSQGRGPGAMLLAHLGVESDGSGPPVRELYEQFVQQHRRDGLGSLLTAYPVFGRLIGQVVNLWQIASLELLERVSNDRPSLETIFGIPQTAQLVAVRQGLSDPHRGGRAVAILSFADSANNTRRQVVYKPKDMGVDAAFQALLADLNTNSTLEPLRTLAVHAADGYGYMEFVEHQHCKSDEELHCFYTNAGRLTALLHLLGCTDCHHENLIASGDQLLLIDTETLLEADLPDHIRQADTAAAAAKPSNLQTRFLRSVLRSGLLPQWLFIGGAKRAVDISALGISPPSEPEQQYHGWLGINSDGMMPGRVRRPSNVPTSLPVGIGATNPFDRFLETFCEGFTRQAQALVAQRERWLQPASALNRFAGLQRRIVLRATRVYFALQRQQLEPEALRSPQAQALKLEQLARSFLLAETKPLHWPVFAAERRQMQQLDIPFFTHRIDGDALELDADASELRGFIQTSGLQAARERLRAFDQNEIDFQLSLIRGAVQARQLHVNSGANVSESHADATNIHQPISDVQAASRIAEQLLAMAIHDPQGPMEWLGMDLGADGESFSFGPVGTSLYGGSLGIACLLKQLEARNVRIEGAAEAQATILKPLRDLVEHPSADGRRRWWRDQPLGLIGCGGVLLALQQLDERPLAEALLADALPRFITADQQLDLLSGCAGLIGALLQLNTPGAIELAVQAGRHLLAQQDQQGTWNDKPRQSGLLGMSHGTAGCAAALAQLHASTGDDAFARAARTALTHERARFNPARGNWPDLRQVRSSSDTNNYMVSWCHGAPGIGLGRACLWGTDLWDEQCAEEINVALATTAATTTLKADHLCCGTLGLMVVLRTLASGPWPLQPELRQKAAAVVSMHSERARERCTGPRLELRCFGTKEGGLVLPGFFTGLSGMGMALLADSATSHATANLLSAGLCRGAWPVEDLSLQRSAERSPTKQPVHHHADNR